MATPATATTTARLATVFQASGCDFSSSILTARDGLPVAVGLSFTVTKQTSGLEKAPTPRSGRSAAPSRRRRRTRRSPARSGPRRRRRNPRWPGRMPPSCPGRRRWRSGRPTGRGPRYQERVDVRAALPVLELAYVVIASDAVEPPDVLPAQEDVGGRLHQPLTRDHALAVVRVGTGPEETFEHRRLCLLDLQEQRIIMVPAEQQHDVAAGADAAHAHHLVRRVDVAVLLEGVVMTPQGAPVRAEQLLDQRVRILPFRSRPDQVLDRDDDRRVGHDAQLSFDLVRPPGEHPGAVAGPRLGHHVLHRLGLAPADPLDLHLLADQLE